MDRLVIKLTLPGQPVTKKNSQQILKNGRTGKYFISPSRKYTLYENTCLWYIRRCDGVPPDPIGQPVNVCCLYYMKDRHRCDLVNLLEATNDILVKARILEDDHSGIIKSHDGSRVLLAEVPELARVEVTIEVL